MTPILQIFARARLCACMLALAALIALPGGARAGDVLLTVTGAIASDKPMTFDRDALADLPQTQFTTSTVWTEGRNRFAGVRLRDLLDAVGAHGATMHLVAVNDYAINVPTADADDGPLIAYEMNGKPMSMREKGPLWIVYPYDSDVRFRTKVIYGRSVWQLVRIDISD